MSLRLRTRSPRASINASCGSPVESRRFRTPINRSAWLLPRSLSIFVAIEREEAYARNQHDHHSSKPDDDSPIWPGHMSPSRARRRESFVRLPALTSTVELHQTSVRHLSSLRQADGIRPSLHERGTIRGEGPSGEECTPGRSRPLGLCSTEDHDHHLRNEAAAM